MSSIARASRLQIIKSKYFFSSFQNPPPPRRLFDPKEKEAAERKKREKEERERELEKTLNDKALLEDLKVRIDL